MTPEHHGKVRPVYLIAGGGPSGQARRDNSINRMFEHSGMVKPTLAYIGAASGDSVPFFRMISGVLLDQGAGDVTAVSSREEDLVRSTRILNDCDMVFISGGDVDAGMQAVSHSGLNPILHQLFRQGKPFSGVSAGAIMLSRFWLRWDSIETNTTPRLFDCLGFAHVLCDTHGEQDGWDELQQLLQLNDQGTIGYGIRSGGALIAYPDRTVEALTGTIDRLFCDNGIVERMEPIEAR